MNPSQEPLLPSYAFDPIAWEEPVPYRRPWRRVILVGVLSALAVAAAGLVFGLIWHFVAPTVPVVDAYGNAVATWPHWSATMGKLSKLDGTSTTYRPDKLGTATLTATSGVVTASVRVTVS